MILFQFAHGDKFGDAIFDVFQAEVIGIQTSSQRRQVERIRAGHTPRQIRQPVEARPRHAVFGGVRIEQLQLPQFFVDDLQRLGGHP